MFTLPQFENVSVDVEVLPKYETGVLHPMERSYLKSRMISWGIWVLIIIAACSAFFFLFDGSNRILAYSLVSGIAFLLIFVPFVFSYFGYFQKAYGLREKDILYKSGLFWRSTTLIPFNRIQHTEVNHGPIDRLFGLASLKVFTAGGSSSDLTIPGLSDIRAHQLKDFITRKTGMDEQE